MSAKRQGMRIVFLAILTTAFLASAGLAAEGTEPTVIETEGYVNVLRDANDVILSVQLVADEQIYDVMLDAKGLELGEQAEDEDVEVAGVVSRADDQQLWLKVRTFKVLEEEQW